MRYTDTGEDDRVPHPRGHGRRRILGQRRSRANRPHPARPPCKRSGHMRPAERRLQPSRDRGTDGARCYRQDTGSPSRQGLDRRRRCHRGFRQRLAQRTSRRGRTRRQRRSSSSVAGSAFGPRTKGLVRKTVVRLTRDRGSTSGPGAAIVETASALRRTRLHFDSHREDLESRPARPILESPPDRISR